MSDGTATLDEVKVKYQKPYNLIVLNDDHHTMDFVVAVIQKVTKCPFDAAVQMMLQVHRRGRAIVWTGCLEQAEFKHEQIQSISEGPLGPIGSKVEQAS
jgi:ATP-dependent Clp protease adaptor protein ClpS